MASPSPSSCDYQYAEYAMLESAQSYIILPIGPLSFPCNSLTCCPFMPTTVHPSRHLLLYHPQLVDFRPLKRYFAGFGPMSISAENLVMFCLSTIFVLQTPCQLAASTRHDRTSLTHPNTCKMQAADGAQCAPQSTIKKEDGHRTGPNDVFPCWPTFLQWTCNIYLEVGRYREILFDFRTCTVPHVAAVEDSLVSTRLMGLLLNSADFEHEGSWLETIIV